MKYKVTKIEPNTAPISDEYTLFLIKICGWPKRKQEERANQLGWRKATAAERKAGSKDWIKKD